MAHMSSISLTSVVIFLLASETFPFSLKTNRRHNCNIPMRMNGNDDFFNPEIENSISKGFLPTGPSDLATVEEKQKYLERMNRSPAASRYFSIIEKASPNDMIEKFASTASIGAQAGLDSQLQNIIGTLPNYALESAVLTTSTKLSNLLQQMQMTGYMFKSAEYRMNFIRSLKGFPRLPNQSIINNPEDENSEEVMVYTTTGQLVAVKSTELNQELSQEIIDLRTELALLRKEKEQELQSNLLTYIQALPAEELTEISNINPQMRDAIGMLVESLLEKLGVAAGGPEMVIQQQVGAMAQLCKYQMVMGYKLRELEALDLGVDV
eukprot:CAMPEP_0119037652 /NCGR_PEP_ID=MMETSP1177-20130426/6139_1 /TAXON_ID=2985 /ORGANISM="Ochromonas sp, Strain CCMP1899" /LENGTH=322 /DNA_ID=CAMNT_0006999229 /DNA_START=137 /DNA_END=1105 /DNA_ORIENTATION=+